MGFELPDTIVIRKPQRSVLPRGRVARKHADPVTTLRLPKDEIDAIADAARLVGMTRSWFIRWVAYQAANEILNLKEQYDRFGE